MADNVLSWKQRDSQRWLRQILILVFLLRSCPAFRRRLSYSRPSPWKEPTITRRAAATDLHSAARCAPPSATTMRHKAPGSGDCGRLCVRQDQHLTQSAAIAGARWRALESVISLRCGGGRSLRSEVWSVRPGCLRGLEHIARGTNTGRWAGSVGTGPSS